MKTKRILCLLIAFVLCMTSVSALAVDEISEEVVVTSETAVEFIDYAYPSNWAYWKEGKDKSADLFFICPTVDMGKDGNFNSDINNEKYRDSFVGAINMELGIYNEDATVYAPYYRQATFPVYNLDKEEQEKYLSIAYDDVKRAFISYADRADETKPLILAGFSQGADLTIRLLKDLFDEPKYQRRLVAAYAIGWKLTEDEAAQYPHLKPAEGETDTGVIVAFNSEDPNITSSLIVSEDEKTYSINPLNWKTSSEVADKALNSGACFTDYSGNIKEEIPNLTGAYIDDKRGTLKVTDINPEEYPGKLFEDGIYHLYDYQFFYRNLKDNVAKRLDAYNEKNADRLNVFYNYDIMTFDVEPIIENGRTLVPFRAIFEIMGCAVSYTEEDGKQIVSARRADDSLMLVIGENKMYFNNEEISLDVPAKIKDGRTLVPIRAISEAFECEVYWNGDTKSVDICSPVEAYHVHNAKFAETITDDKGNALIEVVIYYPVIENPTQIPYIDEVNSYSKWYADMFMEEAMEKKEDALSLRKEMGEDAFVPFVYEQTFEQNYNVWGYFSYTNHKYVNLGGIHPTNTMDSLNYSFGLEEEMSVSTLLGERVQDMRLVQYVTKLFVDKLHEIAPESADIYTSDYVSECLGYIDFYITDNSLVLYFNQGDLAPYALGTISVEIPYDSELFQLDLRDSNLVEYVYEHEYDDGYEWRVLEYTDDKLEITEESIDYPPEEIYSQYYPVGVKKVAVKGIKKGNASMTLAHVKKGEGADTANLVYFFTFYIDEDNRVTLVAQDEAMYLLN